MVLFLHAPGGGDAFIAGSGNATTGQIGVSMTGTFPQTAAVSIHIPAYLDLSSNTAVISSADTM